MVQSLIPVKGVPKKPFLSFRLNSPLVDLDEIMPVEQKVKPKEKQPVKTAPPFPDIDASGQVEAAKIQWTTDDCIALTIFVPALLFKGETFKSDSGDRIPRFKYSYPTTPTIAALSVQKEGEGR